MSLESTRQSLNEFKTQRSLALVAIKEEKSALAQAKERLRLAKEAQEYLQEAAKQVQHEAHKKIASVVSKCLSAVFEQPYELRIELEKKRGKTEASFTYLRDGYRIDPKLTSGGVLEVASLALRLASLVLSLPPKRRLLALDEPWGALDNVNMGKMGALIEQLAEELGVQFIIVTHSAALQVGKVIDLSRVSS